jgi:ubiquinol oxidase
MSGRASAKGSGERIGMMEKVLRGSVLTEPAALQVAHYKPIGLGDHIAFGAVKFLRFFADAFFRHRYGHRAVVLETVAAVPGMVGGMLIHLRALRRFQDDRGWIRTLLDEAENERAHLMTFIQVAKPNWVERALIILAQGIFFNGFFVFYLFWPRIAHRFVGYLEEEAVYSRKYRRPTVCHRLLASGTRCSVARCRHRCAA